MSIEYDKFDVLEQADSVCFIFSSTMDNIDRVIIEAIDYLYSRTDGIKQHAFAINLVLREGLTNAIRHGNDNDPRKDVKLTVGVSDNKLIKIAIEDQGQGFDWKEHQDADLPEDEDHGRGIIIIDTYFTNHFYNDKGNILYLEKEILSGF
ncbi:MAG: ATP-binding protein [Pseudomonadota bacterium]